MVFFSILQCPHYFLLKEPELLEEMTDSRFRTDNRKYELGAWSLNTFFSYMENLALGNTSIIYLLYPVLCISFQKYNTSITSNMKILSRFNSMYSENTYSSPHPGYLKVKCSSETFFKSECIPSHLLAKTLHYATLF